MPDIPVLTWKRTGKITLRTPCGEYLIMRLPSLPGNPQYLALYGPQCARITIGRYDTAAEAQTACQGHADAIAANSDNGAAAGQKNTPAE